ncbi:MAG: trehalose-phosphatase [Roseibium sp.]|nr:trehalose-phosphatase [Roseibium sp.]
MNLPPPLGSKEALFLDFDGTLVDLAPRPDAVSVSSGLPDVLARLRDRLQGAVAVISGRPITEIDHHLAPLHLPAAGLHGLEHRSMPGADIIQDLPSVEIDALKAALEGSDVLRGGVFLETKGPALAVHYRASPDKEQDVRRFMAETVGAMPDLHLVEGKMVVEAKPNTTDKGHALRKFMDHAPFAERVPIFIGDDVTDEDGHAAAQALGGFGVKVGAGESCARFRLEDVAAVHAWLAAEPISAEN